MLSMHCQVCLLLLLVAEIQGFTTSIRSAAGLDALETSVFETLSTSLILKVREETDDPLSCVWLDEENPKFLTGLARYTTNDNVKHINVWMGPSYDCPHLIWSAWAEEGKETFAIDVDYVVRGPTPIGGDPQMFEKYYSSGTNDFDGIEYAPIESIARKVLVSPIRTARSALTLPQLTEITKIFSSRWLEFVSAADVVPGRSRGAMNNRDDKQRQFFYKHLANSYSEEVGRLASGPLAEAYVGGGS